MVSVGKSVVGEEFRYRDDSLLAIKWAQGQLPNQSFGPHEVAMEIAEIQRLYNETEYKEHSEKVFASVAKLLVERQGVTWTDAYNIVRDWGSNLVRSYIYESDYK